MGKIDDFRERGKRGRRLDGSVPFARLELELAKFEEKEEEGVQGYCWT